MSIDKDLIYYLAGPMTNVPHFNIPLFDEAARQLRGRGYSITSPAELDDPTTRTSCLASPDGHPNPTAHGGTWGDFLSRDVKLIADKVGGILFLPDAMRSRGARLEAFVGLLTGKTFGVWVPDSEPVALDRAMVREMLKGAMP